MPSTRQRVNKLLESFPLVQEGDGRILAICIGVAFMFWLILNLSRDYTINKEVSITFQPPENQLLVNETNVMADLTIQGQGWNLLWESLKNPVINALVRLDEQSDGYVSKGDVARLVEQQLASSQLTIEQLNYNPVRLETAEKDRKKVPVTITTDFQFANGYRSIGAPRLSPDSITVLGLAADLAKITHWTTDTLVGADFNTNIRLTATLSETDNDRISITPKTVQFDQAVEAFTEKSLYVPVTVRNAPIQDSFKIFPRQVRLKVATYQSSYHSIVADSFLLVADLKGMRTEDQRNSIPLVLEKQPTGAISVQYSPRAAEYFLIKQ